MGYIYLAVVLFTGFTAGIAVFSRGLVSSVVALALASVGLTASFYLLQAPDVAMAEAVISAGLSTALFLFALRKMGIRGD